MKHRVLVPTCVAALLVAGCLGAGSHEAVAWLRVRRYPSHDQGEYDAYRKTQIQLIKSPLVLTAALRQPGIASLPTLSGQPDPVGWLARAITVAAPEESEVIQVRLRGANAREAAQIVNAVTQAYLSDVVNKERTERLARRDELEKKYKENMAEVRTRLETFNNLARSLGTRDSAELAKQQSLLLDHLSTLQRQLTRQQRDVVQIATEHAIIDASKRLNADGDGRGDEDAVDASVLRHPQIADLTRRLAELDETIAFQAERSARSENDPSVKRLMAQREDLARRIDANVVELRPQVVAEAAGDATRRPGATPALPRMQREIIAQPLERTLKDLEQTLKEFDRVAKEVIALGNASTDLEARRKEIVELQAVTNQMGIQLNASEVDIAMPNRVELIELAQEPKAR